MRRAETSRMAAQDRRRILWFAALVAATCFEGLGRKLLPGAPSALLYYAKDVILLLGIASFGIDARQLRAARRLLRGFGPVVGVAFLWTLAQVFNPSQPSFLLALIGLRSYWLWWIAPIVIATALRNPDAWRRATYVLPITAVVVVAYAAFQFASPADAAVNAYASYGGEQIVGVATVGTTGRARVASTFSYLTGFTDFLILVPPVLLGIGMEQRSRRARAFWIVSAGACLAAIPLSGSRAPLLLAIAGLLLFARSSGLLRTKKGIRATLAAGSAAALTFVAAPEAVQGLTDRFRLDDTHSRVRDVAQVLPPVAIAVNDYPLFGDGTGTQQNARYVFGVTPTWDTESETSRLLAELGPIGYLLVWTTKVGLAVALLRLARRLNAEGKRGVAGASAALALFAFLGNSAFDHVWQAVFFIGVGLVLAAHAEGTAPAVAGRRPPPGWRPR